MISRWRPLGMIEAQTVRRLAGGTGKDPAGYYFGRLPLLTGFDGSTLAAPVMIIVGGQAGPTGYLGAGIHGDEINGIEAVRRTALSVDAGRLKGALIVVPIQNPFAFWLNRRSTPRQSWDADLNRTFPGSVDGAPNHRIAERLFQGLVTGSDWFADIHAATTGDEYGVMVFLPDAVDEQLDGENMVLAQAFGPDAVNRQGLHGTLARAAASAGIPGITAEIGAGGRVDEALVERGTAGLLRMLGVVGQGEVGPPEPVVAQCVGQLHTVRGEQGGIFIPSISAGARVTAGQALGRIFGLPDEQTVVAAPVDGIVLRVSRSPSVLAGDRLFLVGEPVGGF